MICNPLKRQFIPALFILAVLLNGCGTDAESSTGTKKEQAPAIPVEVATVTRGDVAAYFAGTATLEAEEEAIVVARVEGLVEAILVEEGQRVSAGQVIARLDRARLEKQLQQSRANLNKLESDYKRGLELFDNNLISVEEFQRTKSEYEAQKATFELSELELNYTQIRAPISGVVSERMVKIGNMVSLHAPVYKITDFDPLHAILYVPEREIGKLQTGQSASFSVDAHPEIIFYGEILRISPVVDASSGTVKVTLAVKDTSGMLKPGMFARVTIIYDTHLATIVVPKSAVVVEDEQSSVFVVRDSLSFRQLVETGYINGTKIEVTNGLKPGDTVVTIGQGALRDSSRVGIVADSR